MSVERATNAPLNGRAHGDRRSNGESFAKGGQQTPEYRTWLAMRQRCYTITHMAYARYGGRGIGMCGRWRDSYANFLADMGRRPTPRHTLDRIDNEKGYEPSNCRWVTRKEQARNKRNNHLVTAFGATKTIAEWAEIYGVPYCRIHRRLKTGWAPETAITKAPRLTRRTAHVN